MARLIDANALKENCDIKIPLQSGCNKGIRTYVTFSEIDEAPTVDAVSVVHGAWEEKEIFCIDDDPIIEQWQSARCSMCERYHTTPYMYYFTDYNYCPYCGADMREHKESE